jgi:cytochrome oxidase Cu insertion factor (SCO1/SenC/PrrC family)
VIPVVASLLFTIVPVHGLVLKSFPDGTAIVRTDPVMSTLPPLTRRYRTSPRTRFADGTSIDALLDESSRPPRLREAVAAAAFAPGLPEAGRVVPVRLGNPLPAAELVDQGGRIVALASAFRGKTLLLSFVFTRCPDRTLCPAITGKFAYLQVRLDPRRFALAEITLDPQYDSPTVLRRYGAAYDARPEIWTFLTGTGSAIKRVLDEFGISSMRVSSENFLHDDRLFIVTPSGRVADVVETGGWDPQSVLAQAREVSGLSSNPFERFKLAMIADVVALCGGSESTGIVLLELSLFSVITIVCVTALWLIGRVLWSKHNLSS